MTSIKEDIWGDPHRKVRDLYELHPRLRVRGGLRDNIRDQIFLVVIQDLRADR